VTTDRTRFILGEEDIPKHWYNIIADLPSPPEPVLHPGTKAPVGPQDLAPLFPMEIIKQEVSSERWIEIPGPVRDIYRMYRPSPLVRAKRLEKALDTPAHIYYKYEGGSPSGSHKMNTAVAQAFYSKQEGVKRITTETGAGQWGTALSIACEMFGLECTVYMVKVSFEQKPHRRTLMESFGATVYASPSHLTNSGRKVLGDDPNSPGSLGIAISEAVEDAATHDDAKYALGSVLNHVLMHQTVIGQETLRQFEMAGEYPDEIYGCVGGGSNFGGLAFPFVRENLLGHTKTKIVACEPAACPSLTRGVYTFDYGDTVGITPIVKMHTLGHDFIPPGIHAGGLRYHGAAPLLSQLVDGGHVMPVAFSQLETFQAALQFARAEGIVPAPEPAHALRGAVKAALEAKESGEPKVILVGVCGHGNFDMVSYEKYLAGQLEDYEYPAEKIAEAMAHLPQVAAG
jgi:tryptophan synthase beta chain